MNKVDILIPCYNEDKNVSKLVSSWRKVVENDNNFYVYFIDNGSTDSTYQNLQSELDYPKSQNLNLIQVSHNTGYGAGIQQGFKETNHEIVCWTHADLQIPVDDVVNVIKKYVKNEYRVDYIYKGERINRNLLDSLFTKLMSIAGFLITGYFIHDINAQPKVFSRENVLDFESYPKNFAIDAHILQSHIKAKKKIKSIKTTFKDRVENDPKGGGSLLGKIKLSFETLKYFLSQRKNK